MCDVEKECILSEGRVVIIVNYLIGLFDVFVFIKLVSEVCYDLKVVVNEMFMVIELFYDMLLFVNNM